MYKRYDILLNDEDVTQGIKLYYEKQYEKALTFLDQALIKNPNSLVGNLFIGLVKASMSQYKESNKYLNAVARYINMNFPNFNDIW